MKRSARQTKPNSKYFAETGSSSDDPKKKCERSGCPATVPICFARASERCVGSSWTSRWYHVTLGEHYCNECFEHFYRSHKDGYKEFDQWKRDWSSKARTEATIVPFMAEQILPYWVQCVVKGCGKWRQLSRDCDLTPEFIDTFQCGRTRLQTSTVKREKEDACSVPEDERVHYVHSPLWLIQNKSTPYLQKSPAAPFLKNYYPDGVGLSPTEVSEELTRAEKKKLCPYTVPFPKGDYPLHAFGVTPDMMLDTEIESFPLMAQECPYLYLAIRNLIMALWALNPKEWVSKEKCTRHIICRGLTRVSCIEVLPQILSFLTRNHFVNQGLVIPPPSVLSQINSQGSVIVIGAGASGLGAAHFLHSHGVKVTVIEAKDSSGGRICDKTVDGTIISTSGQLLSGCYNNPVALMAYQAGIDMHEQKDTCQLITEHGKVVDDTRDRRIEFHYNAILDIVSEWRKNKSSEADVSLITKFQEFHDEFIKETQGFFSEGVFSQEEEQVLNFYLSNLEFACGSSLDHISSLHWDQNEEMPQFGGAHMVLPEGYGSILAKLAEGLDIRYNCQVTSVDYSGSEVILSTNQGPLSTDKVIVTIPVAVLKTDAIRFHPPLSEAKTKAINAIGAGLVEKVMLQFDQNFWSEKVEGHHLFGHVASPESKKGLFNVFYHNPCSKTGTHILSTYLVGQGLAQMENKSDQEIIQSCMQILRKLFPQKEIPDPVWSHVTHWKDDPHIGMAYSFMPVGTDGSAYDVLAEEIKERVYFAGEATNRQFPQTVTGAYLSGVREGRKILDALS